MTNNGQCTHEPAIEKPLQINYHVLNPKELTIMKLKTLSILILLLAFKMCEVSDTSVKFNGIRNGLAHFEVENHTKHDIMAMDIELTYKASDRSIVLVDTVNYSSDDVFLKAEHSTTFVQRAPEGATSASGRVIVGKVSF
jgi:hypothetical protein